MNYPKSLSNKDECGVAASNSKEFWFAMYRDYNGEIEYGYMRKTKEDVLCCRSLYTVKIQIVHVKVK